MPGIDVPICPEVTVSHVHREVRVKTVINMFSTQGAEHIFAYVLIYYSD